MDKTTKVFLLTCVLALGMSFLMPFSNEIKVEVKEKPWVRKTMLVKWTSLMEESGFEAPFDKVYAMGDFPKGTVVLIEGYDPLPVLRRAGVEGLYVRVFDSNEIFEERVEVLIWTP